MSGLDLTGADLIRALGDIARRPAVDAAVRDRAEQLAADVARATGGPVTARVLRRGDGNYVVDVSGPGLFAREFGSLAAPPDPVVGPAVARLASPKA